MADLLDLDRHARRQMPALRARQPFLAGAGDRADGLGIRERLLERRRPARPRDRRLDRVGRRRAAEEGEQATEMLVIERVPQQIHLPAVCGLEEHLGLGRRALELQADVRRGSGTTPSSIRAPPRGAGRSRWIAGEPPRRRQISPMPIAFAASATAAGEARAGIGSERPGPFPRSRGCPGCRPAGRAAPTSCSRPLSSIGP